MADTNSTQPVKQERSRREYVQKAATADLIDLLDKLLDEAHERNEKIESVALGGESWAGQIDKNGNVHDYTARGIFRAIDDMASEITEFIAMRDAIAELKYRAAEGVLSK